MSREAFHQRRASCVGGSDVWEIVCGDPFKVYCEKRGLVEPIEDNDALRFGRRFERPILEEYASRHPELTLTYDPGFFRHPEFPFIGGNLDAEAVNEHGDSHIPDAKNVDRTKAHLWDEESSTVPEKYALQIQHYCFLRGVSFGVLVACFGGNTYKEFIVPYDAELYEGLILPKLAEFWQRVEAGEPPEPDFTAAHAVELQKRLYRTVRAEMTDALPATKELLHLIGRREIAQRVIRQATKEKDAITAQLLSLLGESAGALVGNTGIKLVRSEVAPTFIAAYQREGYTKLDVRIPKAMKAELPEPDINALLEAKAE